MSTLPYLQPENHSTHMDDGESGYHNEPDSMSPAPSGDLLVAKVTAMATLGVISFLMGIVPVKLSSWLRYRSESKVTISGHGHSHGPGERQPAVVSLLLCFGGGVLLFTTFLHLQPEVRESMQHLVNANKVPKWLTDSGLSLSDIVFCCGFFFVYLVEESVHWLLDRNDSDQEDEEAVLHRTMSLRRCSKRHNHATPANVIPRASLSSPTVNGQHMINDAGGSGNISVTASTQGLLIRDQISVIDIKSSDHSPLDPQIRMTGGPLQENATKGFKGEVEDDLLSTSNSKVVAAKSFRGLLAVLALSFHAVFEGLAVGLESSVRNVWYMFAAIATHKFVIAFCVGIGLVSSGTRFRLIVLYMATFALVTPLGIGIGIGLTGQRDTSGDFLLPVVLQGMAAGTLLYVVFFEVLQRERNANAQPGSLQLAAIFAGFCTMLALQLSLGHEHSHNGSHTHSHSHSHSPGETDFVDYYGLVNNQTDGAEYHHQHSHHDHHGQHVT